ncbi:imidazolonepropionase-like domain-containing protein [Streptomyces sp. NPDC090106]|uniref:imidazolonepropionase-like domain-containing protein n=1 Tax=Streptomyces sp. NPDC090106 TaxID=3365946 RepID=UPI00381AC0AF
METIHTADELRRTWSGEPVEGGAVLVDGDRIGAVGTLADLRERFPGARVRVWPGALGPARVFVSPLPDAPSPRETIHAVLKSGATTVLAEYVGTPELRAAAERNGVLMVARAQATPLGVTGRADLAVFDADGTCLATVCAGRLVHRRR